MNTPLNDGYNNEYFINIAHDTTNYMHKVMVYDIKNGKPKNKPLVTFTTDNSKHPNTWILLYKRISEDEILSAFCKVVIKKYSNKLLYYNDEDTRAFSFAFGSLLLMDKGAIPLYKKYIESKICNDLYYNHIHFDYMVEAFKKYTIDKKLLDLLAFAIANHQCAEHWVEINTAELQKVIDNKSFFKYLLEKIEYYNSDSKDMFLHIIKTENKQL